MRTYGFNTGEIGLSFVSLSLGGIIGVMFNPLQESWYRRTFAKRGAEARLYFAAIGGLLVPVGCFVFAWSQGRTHWIVPLIGIVLLMTGTYWIYVSGRMLHLISLMMKVDSSP